MSADSFVGPVFQAHTRPDHSAALRTLLIRLARKAAFNDSTKLLNADVKVGDLVVEFSSWAKVPDPSSIGFLAGIGEDDFGGKLYFIRPLGASPDSEPVSWGNAMFLPLDRKHWEDLGIGASDA